MQDERLPDQIAIWHAQRRHGQIIAALEALPPQRQTGRLKGLLARAYINLEDFSPALELLEGLEESDGLACVRRGLALYGLRREDEALAWFVRARETGIEELDELPGSYDPSRVSAWVERAARWAPRRAEKNAFERERRKNRDRRPSPALGAGVPEGLWDDNAFSLENYVGRPPSEADFARAEAALGYRLPGSYKALMRLHNGGLLAKNAFENPLQRAWAPEVFSVESLYGVDCEKRNSLCGSLGSRFWIEEWGYPDIGVALCGTRSGGHDLIFLDYSDCGPEGEPCVVQIDQESRYEITYLADNFPEFLEGLFPEEE